MIRSWSLKFTCLWLVVKMFDNIHVDNIHHYSIYPLIWLFMFIYCKTYTAYVVLPLYVTAHGFHFHYIMSLIESWDFIQNYYLLHYVQRRFKDFPERYDMIGWYLIDYRLLPLYMIPKLPRKFQSFHLLLLWDNFIDVMNRGFNQHVDTLGSWSMGYYISTQTIHFENGVYMQGPTTLILMNLYPNNICWPQVRCRHVFYRLYIIEKMHWRMLSLCEDASTELSRSGAF